MVTEIVEAVLIGSGPHVNQVLLKETATSEEQGEFVRPVLDPIGDVIGLRESALFRRGNLEVVVISIFSVDEEKGVLETLVYR
jgi:hypothetical protein